MAKNLVKQKWLFMQLFANIISNLFWQSLAGKIIYEF